MHVAFTCITFPYIHNTICLMVLFIDGWIGMDDIIQCVKCNADRGIFDIP